MRKTAINLTSVIGGEVLLRAANFVAVVVIARLYGASILGVYATVLAFVTVAVMIADNGLQVSSIAEVARSPQELGTTLGQIYAIKTLLFLVLALLLGAIGMWVKFSTVTWFIGGFLALRTGLYSYCQLHAGVLKALDRMLVIGTVQAIHCGLLLGGVGLALHYSWHIYTLLVWLLICQSLEFVLSGLFLFRYRARPKWGSPSGCWRMLRRSTPIGITYSTAALILRADVIVLSGLVSSREVGYFAAANIPLVMVYVVSWLLGGVVLPRMVSLAPDLPALQAYAQRWIRFLIFTTVPCCLVLMWVTPPLVRLIYGSAFASTGTLAAIMVLSVPLILTNSIYLNRAIAAASRSVYIGTYLGTGILTLLLDYSLGHLYGAVGIAVAILVRELAMFAGFTVLGIRPLSGGPARSDAFVSGVVEAAGSSGSESLP